MKEVLKIEIQSICIVHMIAIILAIVFFMIFYMKANKDHALKAFLMMQVSIIGWMVFKIFKTVSPTETSRWWFIVAYYFCACVFEVAFLEFTYAYYTGRPIRNKIRLLLYGLPILQFSWVVTNPLHHMFYSFYDFWGDQFGVLFYMHTVIEYAFIFVGFIYGCLTFRNRFRGKRVWYKILIASTILVPMILNFLYITKVLHAFIFAIGIPVIFDITPIVFVFSTLVFVYATFNHNFINLSPIMQHEIVYKLDTPICVLDSKFAVIYINEKLESVLGEDTVQLMKDALQKIELLQMLDQKEEVQIADHIFTMYARVVSTGAETQYLITLHDISDYKRIEEKIVVEQEERSKANEELECAIEKLRKTSKVGARNYVARELHDIIGHSLVVTIKLLEVAKLYYHKEREACRTALSDGVAAIETGIQSMNAITSKESSYTGRKLEKSISMMLDRIKTTEVEPHFRLKGAYHNLEEKSFDMIHRICQELVTNSLKYAQAKEIFLSIQIKETEISMLVMDNGVGCNQLVLGNGLRGIQERLKLIDGKAEFITASGEGFLTKIKIKRSEE
jgi:signal transduction histidine kinase